MKNTMVIGGGLVGSLLAAILAKRGHNVELFERRSDPRAADKSAGKSINLAISTRGWRAVDLIGARQAIEDIAIPMYGRRIHHKNGDTVFQPYGKEGQAIYSVSRGGLNCVLLDYAERFGAKTNFDSRCLDVDFDTSTAKFKSEPDGREFERRADLIFGTDGAFSQVRTSMQKTRRFNYHQNFIPHGYRELLMPAAPDGGFRMEKNALHIWPRGKYMLIALPNLDGSYTCTLFMPYEGKDSFAQLEDDRAVERFFKEQFPDFHDLMPDLATDYREHPLSDLVVIRCYPWVRNRTAILGDASHAVVPFYGQGMNAGFEDARILDELLEKGLAENTDYGAILDTFQKMRKPQAEAIADLALYNYIEMRDLVGDSKFLLQKKIEARIYERHPDKWVPMYSQVTFSHTPYAEALETGVRQDRVMRKVMDLPDIEKRWDSDEVEAMVLSGIAETAPDDRGGVRSISEFVGR